MSQERDGMHWQKNWPASRQENGLFEVWPVGRIFFHFHQCGLHLFLRRQNKNYRTRNASQSQDGGFLEDLFAVCPETWVALGTANLVTFFSEVWQKCTKFYLVQPCPKLDNGAILHQKLSRISHLFVQKS